MSLLKKKSKEEKILAKERERVHKEMMKKENAYRKLDKNAPEEAFVSLQHINKIYDNHVQAVFDFNLNIKPREFIVFVGPSGCGKSTTLRMIAGLEEITYGDMYIDGSYVNDLQPKDRNISMVFQSYALYPHMTVYKNMAFGLKMRHTKKDIIHERVMKAAEILGLTEYLDRKPAALSGGQCQRVALGRAIVRDSKLFLMDEPLSNLDAKLRVQMRSEIVKLHNELQTTTIYVTHDQTEAMTMASRIVVMSKGYIQQIGTPKEIYDHPANMFVASFIGSPSMNIIKVKYKKGGLVDIAPDIKLQLSKERVAIHDKFYADGLAAVKLEIAEYEKIISDFETAVEENVSKEEATSVARKEKNKNKDPLYVEYIKLQLEEKKKKMEEFEKIIAADEHDIMFGVRPEDLIRPEDATAKVTLSKPFKTKVVVPELLGREYYIHFEIGKESLVAKIIGNDMISLGDDIELGFNTDNIHLFDPVSTNLIF